MLQIHFILIASLKNFFRLYHALKIFQQKIPSISSQKILSNEILTETFRSRNNIQWLFPNSILNFSCLSIRSASVSRSSLTWAIFFLSILIHSPRRTWLSCDKIQADPVHQRRHQSSSPNFSCRWLIARHIFFRVGIIFHVVEAAQKIFVDHSKCASRCVEKIVAPLSRVL